jgi:hypothetical protein
MLIYIVLYYAEKGNRFIARNEYLFHESEFLEE